jgi:hypothetical protein
MSYRNAVYPLLDNEAATGAAADWPGGKGVFTVYQGTFGGATVKLQWSPDDGTTWLDVDASGDTYTTMTAAGSGLFELPPCKIRAFVSGGTPSALFATAMGV